MITAAAIFAVLLSVALLELTNVIDHSRAALMVARSAISQLADSSLNDDQKERMSRAAAIRLFLEFIAITWRLVVAVTIPVGLLYLACLFGLGSLAAVFEILSSWPAITAGIVVLLVMTIWRR